MNESEDRKERPILMCADMVNAIKAGRKTQTRRIMTPQPDAIHEGKPYWSEGGFRVSWIGRDNSEPHWGNTPLYCPYGVSGDSLWVRESFSLSIGDSPFLRKPSIAPHDAKVWYRADGDRPDWAKSDWYPSIFMPKWASRLTLAIVAVRVEQVQSISEEDALAEGVFADDSYSDPEFAATAAFERLWLDINGTESWVANPWVWVVEFESQAITLGKS